MITFLEAIGYYQEKFNDSPPYDVLQSMPEEEAIEQMARAVDRNQPIAEDPPPGPVGALR